LRQLRPLSNVDLALLALAALVVLGLLVVLLWHAPSREVPLYLVAAFLLTELAVQYGANQGAGGRYAAVPIAILTVALVHGATTVRHAWLPGAATAVCGVLLVAGLAGFWTHNPKDLRCIDCPEWDAEVARWRATGEPLRIWPYPEWTIRLPQPR
jgi:hypothetical protein